MTDAIPDRLRRWVAEAAPAPVTAIEPIGGGITATKWLVRLDDDTRLVLRWADPGRWGETGREHVRREVLACRLLGESALPAPHLVAADPDGDAAGGPSALLSWRPGRSRLDPLSDRAVEGLARAALAVHAHPVDCVEQPTVYVLRGPQPPTVPTWSSHPHVWRQAIGVRAEGPPPTPFGLLHRDFHLGNLLWEGDRLTGIVDWAETSWGPADLDVAHLCSDFAMMQEIETVHRFREAYGLAGGRLDPDPHAAAYWQVVDILGFLPDPAHILPAVAPSRPDLTADAIRLGLEDLLIRTLEGR